MVDEQQPIGAVLLGCAACCAEVPISAALGAAGTEYVLHLSIRQPRQLLCLGTRRRGRADSGNQVQRVATYAADSATRCPARAGANISSGWLHCDMCATAPLMPAPSMFRALVICSYPVWREKP